VHVKSAPPACATCHAQEAATATKAHQVCNACHEPHSGARLPNATCASCHADRAAGPHQKVPGGCSSCHRAHGPTRSPTPPACGTCHAPASRKGMHLVAGHADCARCHTVHAAPLATRDACTATCHTDRKTHEPNATKCSTCHVFKW
jgi:hypothetical protein